MTTYMNETSTLKIELVISRYNENLDWLKDSPFSKHKNIIYNKGINTNFYFNEKSNIIELPNIGREGETYLHHIIHNYENLSDITVFLPGSVDSPQKSVKALKVVNEVEIHKDSVFVCDVYDVTNVINNLYDFYINDHHRTSNPDNLKINPIISLTPANIRPFGKWFETIFGDIKIQHVSYCGIFCVSKRDILKQPKTYYERLHEEFKNGGSNPEVGHYFERSWEAVFYPLTNPKIIFMTY